MPSPGGAHVLTVARLAPCSASSSMEHLRASLKWRSCRHRLLVAISAAAIATATSCYTLSADMQMHGDNSGTAAARLDLHADFLDLMAAMEGEERSSADVCGEIAAEAEQGASEGLLSGGDVLTSHIEVFNDGETCSIIERTEWTAEQYAVLLASDDTFPIQRTDDGGWGFNLGSGDSQAIPQTSKSGVSMLEDMELDLPVLFLTVTLPGASQSHDADSATFENGNTTFTWERRLDEITPGSLSAETAPSGSTSTTDRESDTPTAADFESDMPATAAADRESGASAAAAPDTAQEDDEAPPASDGNTAIVVVGAAATILAVASVALIIKRRRKYA